MKITREMAIELNNELAIMCCPFRYKFVEDRYGCGNSQIELTLPNTNYVRSFIVNPTEEFMNWLYKWFDTRGIELRSNNDGSILWSASGWDDI